MASQVDIKMTWTRYPEDWQNATDPQETVSSYWNNVTPGTCCKPSERILPYIGYISESTIQVNGLQVNQFAAGWAAGEDAEFHRDIVNCVGNPVARHHGPGTWYHHIQGPPTGDGTGSSMIPDEPKFITAASWVDLRTRFPSSSNAVRYLQYQGVYGLIWGSNRWFAASDGMPLPKMLKRTVGRLNAFAQQGTAYIAPPTRWAHPDQYSVNGTNYIISADGIYRSDKGMALAFGRHY